MPGLLRFARNDGKASSLKTKCPEPRGPGTRVTIARQPPLKLDPRAFLTSQKKAGSNSPNLGFAFGLVSRTLGKALALVTA
jgi:hypothetical protein